MNHIQEWLHFFERVSCFYRQMFMLPLWEKYPKYDKDIWDSLLIFLEGYAFERQGRRPDYFYAGVDALLHCQQQNNNNFTPIITNMIWQHFSQLLNNQGLNPPKNPLYPSTNPDNFEPLGNKLSIVEIIIQNRIVEQDLTFVSYLQNQIVVTNNIQDAFNLMTSIRGIGDKIASFYLRDLVDVMSINLFCVQNRQLLQPVDFWVERTVRILSNNKLNRGAVANWIVTNSLANNICPERVNIGIWFFCSQIIKSEYNLKKALKDLKLAENLINEYIKRLRRLNGCKELF